MKITFISIFPEYYESFKKHSIIKNAINKGIVNLEVVNPRDFSPGGQIDDTLYGGGAGMLLMIEPIVKAIKSVQTKDSYIILLGPRGKTLKQDKVKQISSIKHLILVCGHYEGIDARISEYINEELSIGKYILTGGETASMIVADSVIRLLPGVIKEESHQDETFENNGLLEYNQYTKPINFEDNNVPEVLLNGNHKDIKNWRRQNSIDKTIELKIKEEE